MKAGREKESSAKITEADVKAVQEEQDVETYTSHEFFC